ncbi:MAG: restriction endonuclease subunit S [Spirochaetaceae bacterium]|nr:restriction endonuclease subunit S [Spirochaetaceae bacterium]
MKQTEIGLIPDDWEVKRLGELCSFHNGVAHEDYVDDNGEFILVNSKFISSDTKSKKYSKKQLLKVEENTILMVMSDVPNGKAIAKCFLVPSKFQGTLNQRICMFSEFKMNREFAYRIINRNPYYLSFDDGIKQTNLRKIDVLNCPIPLPPLPEQQRIAKAISDVDALIFTTEKLLQKKRNIKQGTMQELLTGKKRLPGFAKSNNTKMTELGEIPEDWEVKSVSSLLKIGHGKDYKNLKEGAVPVFGTGGYMTSVNDYLYDGDTVCIGRKGTIDKPFFHTGKIWTVDTLFYTYDFVNCIPKFIYYAFCLVDWLSMNEASGVPSLTSKNIEDVFLCIPSNISEQTAIVNVLSDMDAEIEKLSAKLQKYHQLKTAMMQQLLTGKIRLVN